MSGGSKIGLVGLIIFAVGLAICNPASLFGALISSAFVLLSIVLTAIAGWRRPRVWWFALPTQLVVWVLFLIFVEHQH